MVYCAAAGAGAASAGEYGCICVCVWHRRFSIPFNQTKETKWIALFRDVYKSVCNSSPMHYKMMIMMVCVCVCVYVLLIHCKPYSSHTLYSK